MATSYTNTFLERAGSNRFKIHDTRHTNITAAMGAGVNPKAVQVHAGTVPDVS